MPAYVTDPDAPHLGGNVAGGDPHSWAPVLWEWLARRYQAATVLDVGCGEGEALRYFAGLGCMVVGLEGLRQNARRCGVPVVVHDLTRGPVAFTGIDLVWCCEVAEHVEERYTPYLLDTLTCGRVLAMTSATEAQSSGHHHVNCQPVEWWDALLAARGWWRDEEATCESRHLGGAYWTWTGRIYRRSQP